jgi:hypothetical protein
MKVFYDDEEDLSIEGDEQEQPQPPAEPEPGNEV